MFILGVGVAMFRGGSGCEYSFRLLKHCSASVISLFGRKRNFLWSVVGGVGVFWLWINSYNSLWIDFLGDIRFWFVSMNLVYRCCVRMCLSGGLLWLANLINIVLVHIFLK